MANKAKKGKVHILHLEDNTGFARKVKQKLDKEGIDTNIENVNSRKELTIQLEKQPFDIVFMSDIVPGCTGIEALKVAKQMKSETPVVVFSDILDEEVIVNNLVNGASDFLLKTNLDRLGPVVRRVAGTTVKTENKLNFEHFFENSLDLFATCDKDGFLNNLNESWSDVLGFSSQELKAKPFIKYVHQDDLKSAVDQFKSLFESKSPLKGFTCRFMTNNGQVRWLSWNTKLQSDGQLYVMARDVTDQKNKELHLLQDRQNQKKLIELYKTDIAKKTLMADQIRDSVIVTDLKGKITSWNKGSEKVFGYTPQESVGKHIAVIYPDKDYKYIQKEASSVLLEQGPKDFELQMRRKSGDIFEAKLTLDVTRDKAGKINGMIGYAIDLGPPKSTVLKNNNYENYIDYIFNFSPLVTYSLKATGDHDLIFISSNISEVFGYTAEQCLNEENFWRSLVHPDDKKLVDESFMQLSDKGIYSCSLRVKRIDGEYRWVKNDVKYVKDEQGNSLEIIGTWLDIDKQERAEKNQNDLQGVKHKSDSDLLYATEKLKKVQDELLDVTHKYNEVEKKLKKSEQQRIKTEDELELLISRQESSNQTDSSQVDEIKHQLHIANEQAKNLKVQLEVRSRLLKEAELQRDEAVQLISELEKTQAEYARQLEKVTHNEKSTNSYVAEQSRNREIVQSDSVLEHQLQAAIEETELANQARLEFITCVSHELKIALNSILGFSQIISLEDNVDELHKDYLNEISNAGNHLLSLINELLDLTNLETGKIPLACENVCVVELVDECVNLLKDMAENKQVQVSCNNSDTSISVTAYADRKRLKQVLLNVLFNAVKYTYENGQVEVNVVKENGNVAIRVNNSGPDMSNQFFETSGHEAGSLKQINKISSAGIELLITKSLLQLMDGSIHFEFDPHKVISIVIPAEMQKNKSKSTSINTLSKSLESESISEPAHTIIYVEDDPTNLRLVETILAQRSYYHFVACQQPRKLIELVKKFKPSVILIDLNLPDFDGYDLLKQLQIDKDLTEIPVVAVTTNILLDEIERAKEAGFADYLTKPVEINRLLRVIEDLLDNPESGVDMTVNSN